MSASNCLRNYCVRCSRGNPEPTWCWLKIRDVEHVITTQRFPKWYPTKFCCCQESIVTNSFVSRILPSNTYKVLFLFYVSSFCSHGLPLSAWFLWQEMDDTPLQRYHWNPWSSIWDTCGVIRYRQRLSSHCLAIGQWMNCLHHSKREHADSLAIFAWKRTGSGFACRLAHCLSTCTWRPTSKLNV